MNAPSTKMTHVTASKINISVHELELGHSYRNGARGPHPPQVPSEGASASGKRWPHLGQSQSRGHGDGAGPQFPAFGGRRPVHTGEGSLGPSFTLCACPQPEEDAHRGAPLLRLRWGAPCGPGLEQRGHGLPTGGFALRGRTREPTSRELGVGSGTGHMVYQDGLRECEHWAATPTPPRPSATAPGQLQSLTPRVHTP